MRRISSVGVLLVAVCLVSCGDDDGGQCVPDTTVPFGCECPNGSNGTLTCSTEGVGSCDCGSPLVDAGGLDSATDDAGPNPQDVGTMDSATPIDAPGIDGSAPDAGTGSGSCDLAGDPPYVGMTGIIDFPGAGTLFHVDLDAGCDGVARAAYLDSSSLEQNEIVVIHIESDEWVEDARIPMGAAVRFTLGTGDVHLRVGRDGITHVLFVDWGGPNTQRLRYARSPDFVPETVAEVGRLVVRDLHLEVGEDSVPHIAYFLDGIVHYVSRESGSWIGEVAVSRPGGFVGFRIDLAIHGTTPTVVAELYESTDLGIWVFRREERGLWNEQSTVDTPEGTADFSADWVGDSLELAWLQNVAGSYQAWVGTWQDGALTNRLLIDDSIASELDDVAGFQLVADETGRPHIIVASRRSVQHATVRAGRVVTRSLGVSAASHSAAIAVDRFQGVHVAHQAGSGARFQRFID